MTEQVQLIAERIKGLREISGISAETLAADLGLSKDLYLQYESGSVDIPVGFLYELAQKHHVALAAILSGDDPRLHVYCVVRKGTGLKVERRKQYHYESLAANFIHKKAEPFLVSVDPAPESAPMEFNSHPGQEFNYVIRGTMKVNIDGHDVVLNEGDSIYFDSGCRHAMKALNNQPVQFLAIVL
jgi:mannose-6-phosphate isomerase-like protein (cupin superfamily)/DNA-binding XRE family transcriptional regulator